MNRILRIHAWLIVIVFAAGCADDAVREPSLEDASSYVPGRVYNDPPAATAATAATAARRSRPTPTEQLVKWEEPDDPADDSSPSAPSLPSHPVNPVNPVENVFSHHATPVEEAEYEARVVQAHNEIRRAAKLPKLEPSKKLEAAARRHALDMAKNKRMAHEGSDGTTPFDRMKSAGYNFRRAGENVAVGRYSLEGLMNGWMDSPHHKENILGSYSQIGAACATGPDGKRYWCVTFGYPARR